MDRTDIAWLSRIKQDLKDTAFIMERITKRFQETAEKMEQMFKNYEEVSTRNLRRPGRSNMDERTTKKQTI